MRSAESGTTATVASCEARYTLPPLCRGSWVDGDLLDGGHVVFGTIDRASRDDIGAEIAVRVDGDSAWTVTNRLPYILGACGLAVALIGALAGLLAARGAAAHAPDCNDRHEGLGSPGNRAHGARTGEHEGRAAVPERPDAGAAAVAA